MGLTLPLARDLGRAQIRVYAIASGIFETPLMDTASHSMRDPLIDMTRFPKRLGEPHEFAETAPYIFNFGYTNGDTIRLDASIRMALK